MGSRRTAGAVGFLGAAAIAAVVALLPASEDTVRTAYRDQAGNWTICTGHTEGVKKGDTATQAQCRAYLQHDVAQRYPYIERCLPPSLSLNERIAYLHAVFNGGPAIVCGSSVQRLLKQGKHREACQSLRLWVCYRVKPGTGDASGPCATRTRNHKVSRGLVNRRQREVAVCLGAPMEKLLQ